MSMYISDTESVSAEYPGFAVSELFGVGTAAFC